MKLTLCLGYPVPPSNPSWPPHACSVGAPYSPALKKDVLRGTEEFFKMFLNKLPPRRCGAFRQPTGVDSPLDGGWGSLHYLPTVLSHLLASPLRTSLQMGVPVLQARQAGSETDLVSRRLYLCPVWEDSQGAISGPQPQEIRLTVPR